MPRSLQLSPFIGALALLCVGCGTSTGPAADQAAAAVPITPAHMQEHFSKAREIEDAIIRGDVDAAKTPALWIADHQQVAGPAGTERPIKEMKAAARSVASTDDLRNAAQAAASLAGACGSCHAAAKVEPKLPAIVEGASHTDRSRHMLKHQHAVDRMYRGLMTPVSGEWRTGAEELKASPLRHAALKDLQAEAVASEARVHELAERAMNAPDQSSRVSVYGAIIGECASCHGLHGRIWGPGMPKTE